MIRTRLASLALATGLGLLSGCIYLPERPLFPRLRGAGCCNGACETGCCGGEAGCCNGGGLEGPELQGMEGMPPPPPPPEAIAPVPAAPPQRLVPMPQSTPMPYVPS
jgi:hypothetical protein